MQRAQLLHTTGAAAANDSKTVKLHRFELPDGIDALTLRFDYSPRTATNREKNAELVEAAFQKHSRTRETAIAETDLESRRKSLGLGNFQRELNNLMNVVLIDPQGRWRGRWDRNPSSDGGELVLSRTHASKGFLPGELGKGTWTVAIECHGIFGDPVSYELEVTSRPALGEAEVAALSGPAALPVSGEKRRGPGWYFGEMHSHTVHSDGKHELSELARRAHSLGIDFLALTDHNTTSGLLETGALPITLLAGCELTTFHGHHPIYGLTDIVPWHEEGRVLPLEEIAPRVRAKGGLVSVAHPFKIGDPICTGCRMRDDLSSHAFELFEVWYRSWDAPETDNETAYALWNRFWSEGRKVTAVAARDWHGPGQESAFPGTAPFTAVYAEDNTPEAILEGLRQGRVLMSGGPILDFRLEASGKVARVGETLASGTPATGVIQLERTEGAGELRLYRNGQRVRTLATEGDGVVTVADLAVEPGWYRAELWRDGLPRVLSNHVVLA